MTLRRLGALFFALIVVALPAMAQEQTGAIQGVVTDTTGAVIPGASIEARSVAGGVQTTVSDTQGKYNFPALRSGTYFLTATLPGFTTVKMQDVHLSLGQTLKVDFSLRVSTIQEEVTVTGEAPVDVTSTVRSTSIRDEFIDARGYWSPFWDSLLDMDEDFFEAYMRFSSVPWKTGPLDPKIKEFVYIAVDAAATHLYVPGIRQHIKQALALVDVKVLDHFVIGSGAAMSFAERGLL